MIFGALVTAMIDQVFANDDQLEGQKIRAHVMDYHDIKFKASIKRILDTFEKK